MGDGGVLAAAVAMSGCGGSSRPGIAGAEKSRVCTSVRKASEAFLRAHPDAPAAELRASVANCTRSSVKLLVADDPPRVARSSAGCAPAEDVPATPISRRRVAAPDPRAPYFAPRAGVLPRDGAPTVSGISLPKGSRCAHYWASDGPTPHALELAQRLAAVFPQTGLWPVIWDRDETPDDYRSSAGRPRAADHLRAAAVLQRLWKANRNDGAAFGGLAAGSRKPGAAPVDAFGTLAESEVLRSPADAGWVLLLTPVNRPADAITTLGFVQSEILPDAQLTAVARSWEERFGAVLASAGPGELGFAVSDPPHTTAQAQSLAVEQATVSPDNDEGDYAGVARELTSGAPSRAATAWKGFWSLGWPD